MNTQDLTRPVIRMTGTPVFVQALGNTVEIWISSPTGDSSDSHIHHIPCVNHAQAESIARMWKAIWSL